MSTIYGNIGNHGVVRLDKVKSVYHGNIFSVKHNADLDNGNVVKLGALADRDLYTAAVPTAGSGDLVLIAAPEVVVDQSLIEKAALENFYTPANTPVRAYGLEKHDIFSISYTALKALTYATTGIPVVGNYLVADSTVILKEIASADLDTEIFRGKIIALEQIGVPTVVGQAGTIQRVTKFAVIEVESN